jgi:hypothetical protein
VRPEYVVVEEAGTGADREVFEGTFEQCIRFGEGNYRDAAERREMGVDIYRREPDGSLTTEF